MAVSTPKINKIIKMTEFDMLRTNLTPGNMYMCLDTLNLYYDESKLKRSIYSYVSVKTVNDLMYSITPNYGTSYYCWEDNSLWIWMNSWRTLYTDQTYPSAYIYNNYDFDSKKGDLEGVYRYDEMLIPADDNGLLKDGSVVVRDRNRIIKGKIYVNDNNDNLTIGSYLGGGIRFLPNGKMSTEGEFFVGDENDSFLRSELTIKNAEEYIDYTEKPDKDENPFKNDTHRYKVFHEGNLDASKIKEMTPLEVYNKLLDPTLPDPLLLNVNMLNGKTDMDFALNKHTHLVKDIEDFNVKAREQAGIEIKTVMTNLAGEGITIEPKENNLYKLSANTFTINFGGGVTGSGRVNHLTDTTINLAVNPSKHVHSDYIEKMDDMQKQINNINAMDKNNYYTRTQTDELLDNITGTATPTPGKPLLVDSNNILPGTATSATKLDKGKTVTFVGDITGTLSTDFSENEEVELNADNIVSVKPVSGKALKVDSNGNLPGNSETASALNHPITVNLTKEVTGTAQLDTSKNSFSIEATLVPGDNIIQQKDLGHRVAPLDEQGKIPPMYIPQVGGLNPKGTFNPNQGYPSANPQEGDFYIADSDGVCGGENYTKNDWCVYLNGEWLHVQMLSSVSSVNGKIGNVTLNASDVKAISDTLINYSAGSEIPNGYVVKTSANGEITGCGIERLNNEFNVNSDSNSDIEITDTSTNKSTNGTEDLGLNLMITEQGYENIKENASHDIMNNGQLLEHKRYLDFGSGFVVNEDTSTVHITCATPDISCIYIEFSSDGSLFSKSLDFSIITSLYSGRKTSPFTILAKYKDIVYSIPITDTSSELLASGTVSVTGIATYTTTTNTTYGTVRLNKSTPMLQITSDEISTINNLKITTTDVVVSEDLSTSVGNVNTTAFIPTYDCHPATKKYVDQKLSNIVSGYSLVIGDGSAKSFKLNHRLGNEDVLVQCRLVSTGEQVFVSNRIIDANTVQIDFNVAPATNSVKVYIK